MEQIETPFTSNTELRHLNHKKHVPALRLSTSYARMTGQIFDLGFTTVFSLKNQDFEVNLVPSASNTQLEHFSNKKHVPILCLLV